MKSFIGDLCLDLRQTGWRSAGVIAFVIMAVYGMLFMNPTTAYDFGAAKGDCFQVFLTYFFMHRFTQGIIAGLFHDFTPLWNWSVGLLALFVFANLLMVLARRLGLSIWQSLAFVTLWLSAPFFFNYSIYQHAMPSLAIALCFDAIILLVFENIRNRMKLRSKTKQIVAAIFCGFVSLSMYQAHADLLLTAMFGVCCLMPKQTYHEFVNDFAWIVVILGGAAMLWAAVNFGPILGAKLFGVTFPPSGGAHDTIYWFCDRISFGDRFAGLFAGLALNWVYNAFFVVGLRWVLACILLGLVVSIYTFATGRRVMSLYVVSFVLSIFVMACLLCSSSNLRIFFCLNPFIAFSAVLLLRFAPKRKCSWVFCLILITFAILSLAHETSMLYYYQWKLKSHDALHMGNVATDVWRKYGLSPDKPVAVIGGWAHYPACWEDLRPNRDLPLLNYPFSSYSNMSDANVPREFYMVAREKVGLVVDMPPAEAYEKVKQFTRIMPAYPQDGYISEKDGLIVVNLGEHAPRWKRFDFKAYRSPNEKLLFKTLKEDKWIDFKQRMIRPFLSLAKKYPWTLNT